MTAALRPAQVGRYEPDVERMFDFTAERVTRSVEESLARLRVGYIDCIQEPLPLPLPPSRPLFASNSPPR